MDLPRSRPWTLAALRRNLAAPAVRFGLAGALKAAAGLRSLAQTALKKAGLPDGQRTFLHAFERRLVTELTPEGEEEPLGYRAFLVRQARQVRDVVRGQRPFYAPLALRA